MWTSHSQTGFPSALHFPQDKPTWICLKACLNCPLVYIKEDFSPVKCLLGSSSQVKKWHHMKWSKVYQCDECFPVGFFYVLHIFLKFEVKIKDVLWETPKIKSVQKGSLWFKMSRKIVLPVTKAKSKLFSQPLHVFSPSWYSSIQLERYGKSSAFQFGHYNHSMTSSIAGCHLR